jgi:hypothetical protein
MAIMEQMEHPMNFQNIRLFGIIFTVALLLTIPAVAMQFTNEVNWTRGDFVVAGLLLLSTGFACELAIRSIQKVGFRFLAVAAILGACFVLWVELATGFVGRILGGR